MKSTAKIAETVLYEGYLLWPYRRSAKKNHKRWTLGGVYPRGFSEAGHADDPWCMQTECLVLGTAPFVHVTVRFLHIVERQVMRKMPDGSFEAVDMLHIGASRHLTWEEATERQVMVQEIRPASPAFSCSAAIAVPAGEAEELLRDDHGQVVGQIVRSWRSLAGSVEVKAASVQDGVFKLTVRIMNTAPWSGQDRDRTLRHTFVSAHTMLTAEEGMFVSLMDPPEALKTAAGACVNIKTWPVLVGEAGQTRAMLSSPIILYDYPQVAPESPGDLFDGTEIDQLLLLNILTLTDDEKEEMRASDPRAREILARTEALRPSDFMRLHGTIRGVQPLRHVDQSPALWDMLERPTPQRVTVRGHDIERGSRAPSSAARGRYFRLGAGRQDGRGRDHRARL